MAEPKDSYAIWGDLLIKALALVGAVIVYFTHGCRFDQLQTQLSTLELNVKDSATKLSSAQTDLAKESAQLTIAQMDVAKASAQLAKAQTDVAEANKKQIAIGLDPRVVVTADIDQPYIDEPLQEVRLTLTITNTGNGSTDIKGTEVEVFRGGLSAAAQDIVRRASEILDVERQMRGSSASVDPYAMSPEQRTNLEKTWNDLHQKCPHGQLFIVEGAEDIEWKQFATIKKQADCTLPPGQSMRVEFVLMSTHFYNHPIWLRLRPYVTVGTARRGFGDRLVAILPIEAQERAGHTVAKKVMETSAHVKTEDSPYSGAPMLPTTKVEVLKPGQ